MFTLQNNMSFLERTKYYMTYYFIGYNYILLYNHINNKTIYKFLELYTSPFTIAIK